MTASGLARLLGVEHPVLQAGMARQYTSAELVAAVSGAGGLGILGCLGRPADECVTEIRRIRGLTDRPFGVNFVLHRLDQVAFEACLAERVPVFSFFRGGDASKVIAAVHAIGGVTIHQVTTALEADRAIADGVDVIVAQGREAGGHSGPIPLSALLGDVVRRAAGRPVVAAGGIVDGAGLAAALALGASGALVGTRFLATTESPATERHKRAIVEAGPSSTIASDRFDLLWSDERWPGVRVRVLRNRFAMRLIEMVEADLDARLPDLHREYRRALDTDDPAGRPLLAGMGASRITGVQEAGAVVRSLVAEAQAIVDRLATIGLARS